MDIGLMLDGDYREGQTQRQAFDDVLTIADRAETLGFDGIWLAERHFSPPGGAALISSIGSAPSCWRPRSPRVRAGSALGLRSSCYPWGTPCAWRKKSPRSII
jgi:alkanesulfonate monooxygenase SsuD/methylene tetrahydromethanopterin reductase-like flavin-dependent oxidoreductase (luciferase family)